MCRARHDVVIEEGLLATCQTSSLFALEPYDSKASGCLVPNQAATSKLAEPVHFSDAAAAAANAAAIASLSNLLLCSLTMLYLGYIGGLSQYQLMEDSAAATQTERALTDAITKSTLSMIG